MLLHSNPPHCERAIFLRSRYFPSVHRLPTSSRPVATRQSDSVPAPFQRDRFPRSTSVLGPFFVAEPHLAIPPCPSPLRRVTKSRLFPVPADSAAPTALYLHTSNQTKSNRATVLGYPAFPPKSPPSDASYRLDDSKHSLRLVGSASSTTSPIYPQHHPLHSWASKIHPPRSIYALPETLPESSYRRKFWDSRRLRWSTPPSFTTSLATPKPWRHQSLPSLTYFGDANHWGIATAISMAPPIGYCSRSPHQLRLALLSTNAGVTTALSHDYAASNHPVFTRLPKTPPLSSCSVHSPTDRGLPFSLTTTNRRIFPLTWLFSFVSPINRT